MTTILDALQKGTGYLEKHGVESARLNMQHLLAAVVGCRRMDLYVNFDRVLEEDRLEALRVLMRRRAAGVPLQHLTGSVEFLGAEFRCDDRALVPRPETEELVERMLRRRWPGDGDAEAGAGLRILDLGCGSGVIGLSLAAHLAPRPVEMVLADLSPAALDLARENATDLGERLAPERVTLRFVASDLFSGLDGDFTVIAANLPYLSDADLEEVSREVRHDPEMALRGGQRGTELMERFLAEVPARLRPGGWVAMEFGAGQDGILAAAAVAAGLREVTVERDLQGWPRFLFASAPGGPEKEEAKTSER
jgi:release factor glutamine methyltransferase